MKKILIIIVVTAILLGGAYAALSYLRGGTSAPPDDAGLGSSSAALQTSSVPSGTIPEEDEFLRIGGTVLRTFSTGTPEEKERNLRVLAVLKPDTRTKVQDGVARKLVALPQREREVFESQILESYMLLPEDKRNESKDIMMQFFAGMPDVVVSDPPLAGTPLVRGNITAVGDKIATGQAVVAVDPERGMEIRLENFRVSRAPDLHVYLTKNPVPRTPDELKTQGFVDLGSLKGNAGNQNYGIPRDTPVQEFNVLVIYSQTFGAIYAVATTQ